MTERVGKRDKAHRIANAILRGRAQWPKIRVARGYLATRVGRKYELETRTNTHFLKQVKEAGPKEDLGLASACASGFAILGCETRSPESIVWSDTCPATKVPGIKHKTRCPHNKVTIVHLNDEHYWSPEQISEWLLSL